MSWEQKASIISGYHISSNAAAAAWDKINELYEKDSNKAMDFEDLFINIDPIRGDGDIFLGVIIYECDEYNTFVRFDDILTPIPGILKVQAAFEELLSDYYKIHLEDRVPKWDKYLVFRWV